MRDKTKQAIYNSWAAMIQRCTNPNSPDYKNWGGRGITVCERWRCVSPRGVGFKNFYDDMGPRPPQHTLDRINNDGNYEPGNCRWATRKEQALNCRNQESIAKAVSAHAAMQRAKTHCWRGHEYTPENTVIDKKRDLRSCRLCRTAMDRWLYHGKTRPIEEYFYPIGKPGRKPKPK